MRLHLTGLPHTDLTNETTVCAYTAKARKACEMLKAEGHEVVSYWGPETDADVAEHVPCYTKKQQVKWYGEVDPNLQPTANAFDSASEPWQVMNKRTIRELKKRLEPHDIILLTAGLAHKQVKDAFPEHLTCEWGVGYYGIFDRFCCYESYAWMHHLYGKYDIQDGRWFDTVIPNFFRPEDFSLGTGKEGYLLFMGRLIQRKGLLVAADIARETGMTLVIAGPGADYWSEGYLRTLDGCVVEGDIIYIGTVDAKQRSELMGNASAVLCPTIYIEPFGGVAVEAQMTGTPAITTDFGAYSETVQPEWRFRTLAEGIACVEEAKTASKSKFRRSALRERAIQNYSLEAVGPQYSRWFSNLGLLWKEGWYELPERETVAA